MIRNNLKNLDKKVYIQLPPVVGSLSYCNAIYHLLLIFSKVINMN